MSFKALRRSRDAKASVISTPISASPLISKPPSAKTFTPQKVIRAIDNRRATAPQELSFSKGDFFYVTRELDLQSGLWYEAHNPVTGSRGLVPADAFEELSKQSTVARRSNNAHIPPILTSPNHSPVLAPKTPITPRHQTFYAIVQYDFVAERPDELDAKAGEPISVVAQSNREWFVAKPIGRLGGPGLIPVTFVEIRDPSTGRKMNEDEVSDLMDRGSLPKVEEWKKATMEYKASSIPLGVIDSGPTIPSNPYMPRNPPVKERGSASPIPSSHSGDGDQGDGEEILPPGLLIAAEIPSFHRESGEYWFRLNIKYRPDPDPSHSSTPVPISMVLYRNYDDFYAFQLQLLDTWPVEAGREKRDPNGPELTENDRILPYMPGPVDYVDDGVTASRQRDLDIYVKELVELATYHGADYVLRCDLFRRFLAQKPGDVILPAIQERIGVDDTETLQLDALQIVGSSADQDQHRKSHGSAYSDQRDPSNTTARYHVSNGSTEQNRPPSSYSTSAPSPTRSSPHTTFTNHARSPTASSIALNQSENSGVSPAFLKIKIFHSSTDDLIAIRVSPRVTYQQLLTKVKDRLGADVNSLKYRESMNAARGEKGLTTIEGDDGLKEWVSNNSKLVLFAY
ncbi:hypothetical protein BS47DRAFT_1352610 [Hydnum rufescens UP504]|uniref:Uncharacterized protein n=1 Tax=Hydnum rufescens UP504 TaxID=1448309 RepID=A0A9P6AIZ5_9AGAM|nr:hypothetical protein BS47DRAFT_1352610 [Hydnum rufescens UP504]